MAEGSSTEIKVFQASDDGQVLMSRFSPEIC
jgi:hypothetical protein